MEDIVDLISVLIIGEKVEIIAAFIAGWVLECDWERHRLVALIETLAKRLRWTSDFCQLMLLDLVQMLVVDSVAQRSLLLMISNEMDAAVAKQIQENEAVSWRTSNFVMETFVLLFEFIVHEKEMDSIVADMNSM
jgi:hypothetical protein